MSLRDKNSFCRVWTLAVRTLEESSLSNESDLGRVGVSSTGFLTEVSRRPGLQPIKQLCRSLIYSLQEILFIHSSQEKKATIQFLNEHKVKSWIWALDMCDISTFESQNVPVQRPGAQAPVVLLARRRRGSIHQVFEEVEQLLWLDALLPKRPHNTVIMMATKHNQK